MRKTIEETGLQIKFKSANFARGSTLDRNHHKKHHKSRFLSILLGSTAISLGWGTFTSMAERYPSTIAAGISETYGPFSELSEGDLNTLAAEISVQIDPESNSGSGVIATRNNDRYIILTNAHVILGKERVTIKTNDRRQHVGKVVYRIPELDAAAVEFFSQNDYRVANFARGNTPTGSRVWGVGFSSESDQFAVRNGRISYWLNPAFREGYQIGYTPRIETGMSGGAILTSHGTVVGINGMTAHPIIDRAYTFPNGSRPNLADRRRYRQVSWGVSTDLILSRIGN